MINARTNIDLYAIGITLHYIYMQKNTFFYWLICLYRVNDVSIYAVLVLFMPVMPILRKYFNM